MDICNRKYKIFVDCLLQAIRTNGWGILSVSKPVLVINGNYVILVLEISNARMCAIQ